jgi:hypothetical protein
VTGDSPCPASRVRAHRKYVRSAKRPVSECSKVFTNFSNLYISIYGIFLYTVHGIFGSSGARDIRERGSFGS